MQHRNTFTGGMKSGIDFSLFPQDSYSYMLNGCIISKDEHGFMVTNIKGQTAIHTFDENEVPIGSVSFNGILYIITHYIGTNNYIKFYSYKKTNGLTGWDDGMGIIPLKIGGDLSIPQSTLGFTREKLLDVFAKESYDGSVDIYICDGLHKNVIINTGLDRDGMFTLRSYSNLTTPSLFQMQKSVNLIPNVTSSIQNGGNMKPGTYYVYIRYEDDSLNPTPFIKEVGPFFIHSGHSNNNSASGILNEDNNRVNKSILLNINNIDSSYNKISIAVVYYYGLNNVLSRENYLLNRTYQVVNGSVKVIINGDNEQQSIVVEEILKDNLRYNTSETHTQLENRYFGANWKSQDINMNVLKELAKKFIPHAFIKDYTGTGRTHDFNQVIDENTTEFEYMEDEIYPLGVSFLIDGQYKTDVFPIFGWYEGFDYNGEYEHGVMYEPHLVLDVPAHYETVSDLPYEVKWFTWQGSGYHGSSNKCGVDLDGIAPEGGITFIFSAYHKTTHVASNFSVIIPEGGWDGSFDLPEIASNYDISFLYVYDNDTVRYAYRHLTDWTIAAHPIPLYSGPVWVEDTYRNSYTFSDLESGNNYGLYKFPKKYQLFDINNTPENLHFKKIGLKIVDQFAKQFITENSNLLPNITEIYFVQGKRQENIICQGVINPVIEGVGFAGDYEYGSTSYRIVQSTSLGDGNTKCCFPWMDPIQYQNYRRSFPLFKIDRMPRTGSDGVDDGKRTTWCYAENSVTELLATYPTEEVVFPLKDTEANSGLPQKNDLYRVPLEYESEYSKSTKSFAVFSPDILMRNIQLPDNVFIKPIIKLTSQYTFPEQTVSASTEHRYQLFSCSSPSIKDADIEEASTSEETDHLSRTLIEDLDFYNKRFFNPLINSYSPIIDLSFESEVKIIGNDIINGWKGFSSRMKSIPEVYDDDMYKYIKEDLYDTNINYQNLTLNQFFAMSRTENMNAGILINKYFQNHISSKNGIPMTFSEGHLMAEAYRKSRFGFHELPYKDNSIEDGSLWAIPVVVSNLSMKATPYIAVYTKNTINYRDDADDSKMANSIVNLCRFNTIQDYIESIENVFDILGEQYSIIGNMTGDKTSWNNLFKAFKGDVFSQQTFMRTVRHSWLPDSTEREFNGLQKFDYAWKQGQAMNVYLQSFCNSYLRVPSNDDTFMPFEVSNGRNNYSDTVNDFVWKGDSKKFKNETWNVNAGYEKLKGLISLPAFNDIFLNKKNNVPTRIYFSNKQIAGAFTDAYREILLLQYQDFSVANGDIIKLSVFNSTLFSIQEKGINQHFGSQKLKSTVDSSDIILGDREVLGEEYKQLVDFGTQHKESVVVGDNGIYGVDWNKKRIWRIKLSSTTTGSVVFGVEDLLLQKQFHNFFNETKTSNGNLKQELMNDNIQRGIVSVFDANKHEVLFTFKLGTDDGDQPIYKTLVFNEDLDMFVGYYSYNSNMYMTLDNKVFSYSKEFGNNKLWEHNTGDFQKFYDQYYTQPFELEFIVNCANQEQNASQFEKDFLSHLMVSCSEILDSIEWTTEYQYAKKGSDTTPYNPFINTLQFWTNPEYIEDKWTIPILKSTKSNNGPNGSTNFSTFEPESSMKGLWIKVKIKYTGLTNEDNSVTAKYFYLRNVITNFLISYT